MNTWWTNVVHDLDYKVHMESLMNSNYLFALGEIILIHSFFTRYSFMNFDELLFILISFNFVHGMFVKVHER